MYQMFRPSSSQGLLQGLFQIVLFMIVLGAIGSGCAGVPTPTPTTVPPTATVLPSATPVPPTATALPSATPVPPTATALPSATPVPPTATVLPTATAVEPTATVASTVTGSGEPTQPDAAASANPCLACHNYNQLLALKPMFTVQEQKVNPHWYVPHDSKDIPECTTCHEPHATSPLPKGPQDVDMSKVNVEMCFSCHHLQNFTPCKTCHE